MIIIKKIIIYFLFIIVNSLANLLSIKFYYYHNHRISYQLLQYAFLKSSNTNKKFKIIIYSNQTANKYIENIIIKELRFLKFNCFKSNFLTKIINNFINFNNSSNFIYSDSLSNDLIHKNLYPELIINEKLNKFPKYLNKLLNQKYICFMVRDEAYLQEKFPETNWNYHSYRNSDPNEISNLIKKILLKNKLCVRMGAKVSLDLGIKHKNYIDYAQNYRSENLDFLLSRKCELFICDTSGIIYIALSQGAKVLRYNCNIYDMFKPYRNTLSVPVMYFDELSNKILHYNEVIDRSVFKLNTTEEFKKKHIKIIYNNTDILYKSVEEALSKKNAKAFINEEHEHLNNKFFKLFEKENYHEYNKQQRFLYEDKSTVPYFYLKDNIHLYE